MNSINFRVSLDMFEVSSQTTIKAKKGDSACKIHITLTEHGKIYKISEGCYATFSAKKSDGNFVYDNCTIEDNNIVYDFSSSIDEDGICQISACEGAVECEVALYKGDSEQLTSPRFTLVIDGTVYNGEDIISTPEVSALKDLLNETKATVEEIEAKLENGDFQGEPGEKGDSGVYVGSGDMPEGYNVQIDPNGTTLDKQNLMTDYTALVDERLNNVGWTEKASGYTTNRYGIPVTEGKWYSTEVDDFPYQPLYISFKTADNITGYSQSTHIARYTGRSVIQAPTNSKYMFISAKSEQFNDLKIYEGFSSKLPISKSLWTYGKKLMTLGDSLTEQKMWQTIVCGKLGFSSLIDLSEGGQKVAVFADKVTAENIADVDVVTVMGLFNSSDSVAGTVNDEASNTVGASICAGYKYIVEKLYSLKPTIQIILMTPHCPRADDVRNKAEAVIEVAKYYNIPYIDLYKEAGFNKHTFDIYLRDAVHSSHGVGGGYEQEAKVICGNMLKYLC